MARNPTGSDVVLVDGECGVCRRFGGWVEDHDSDGRFEVIPYQLAPDPPLPAHLREEASQRMHVITAEGQVHTGARAVLYVWDALGWPVMANLFWHPPMRWAAELGYTIVARNRPFFAKFMYPNSHPVRHA